MKTLCKLIFTIGLVILLYKGIVYLALQEPYSLLISLPFAGLTLVFLLEKMFEKEMKRFGDFLCDNDYE